MNLPNDITRCLGHTQEGQPNGCDLRDACARHIAIRTTPFDGSCTVAHRCCTLTGDAFIPVVENEGEEAAP